jgi:CRP-like cAMP-binding protein
MAGKVSKMTITANTLRGEIDMTMTSLATGTTSTLRLEKKNWERGWPGKLSELSDEMLNGLCEALYSNINVAATIGPQAIWSSIRFNENFLKAMETSVGPATGRAYNNLKWDFVETLELQQYEEGETIYFKGERSKGVFFLFEGLVTQTVEGYARKTYINSGGTFGVGGESGGCVFGEITRSGTAVAEKKSIVLVCPLLDFERLCQQYRGTQEAMEKSVQAHISDANIMSADEENAKKHSRWGKVTELTAKIAEKKKAEEKKAGEMMRIFIPSMHCIHHTLHAHPCRPCTTMQSPMV